MSNDFRPFAVRAYGGSTFARATKNENGDRVFLSPPPQGMKGTAVAAYPILRWGHDERGYTVEWEDGTSSSGIMLDFDVAVERGW